MTLSVNANARPLPDQSVGEGRSSRAWPHRASKQSRADGGQGAANGEALLFKQRSGHDSRHLERALDGADADDELVFMNERHADADSGAGRVLIRDSETGRVWDPDDGPTPDDPERWIEDVESWNEGQRGSELHSPPYVEAGSLGARVSQAMLDAGAANGSASPPSPFQLKQEGGKSSPAGDEDAKKPADSDKPADAAKKDPEPEVKDAGKMNPEKKDVEKAEAVEAFETAFETLKENFDELNGSDSVFSRKDLHEDYEKTDDPALKKALKYFIDHPEAFGAIDTADKGGTPDGKMSTKDVDAFVEEGGYDAMKELIEPDRTEEDKALRTAFTTMLTHFDDLNGSDSIFSMKDLKKELDKTDDPELKKALEYFDENPEAFEKLDTAKKDDDPDEKISTKDMRAFAEGLGVGKNKARPDGVEEPNDELFVTVAEDNGWTPVRSDDALPPLSVIDPKRVSEEIGYDGGESTYDEDVITYEFEGETYAVSKQVSPFKYSQLENKIDDVGIRRNDNDVEIDLPDSEATDFMNATTTEDGKTVVELFNANMKDEWEDLDTDDPRREYHDLLQMKAALTGGLTYLPNETVEEKLGDAKLGDSTEFGDPEMMDTASLYGLLDEEGIDQRLSVLAEDPRVSKGVDGFMQDAVGKIEDKEGLTDRIHEAMMSPEYEQVLRDSPEGGQARFQNDLLSLEHLDPEKAAEVKAHATYGGAAEAIDEKIENGSYSDEALELAVDDHVKLSLQSTWTSSGLGAFDDEAVESVTQGNFEDVPKEQQPQAKAFKEAFDVARKALVDSMKGGTPDGQPDIEDVAERIDELGEDVSPEAARGLDGFVEDALPGGMTGMLAATASTYDLTGLGADASAQDGPGDRVAAARLSMVSVATGQPAAGLDDSALGKIVGQPGMGDALGLDSGLEPFDEAFAERFPDAHEKPDGSTASTDAINEKLQPAQKGAVDAADSLSGAYEEAAPDQQGRILDQVNDQLNADDDTNDFSTVPTSSKLTFVGASLGTLGSFAGTASSILDIVKGGSAIDELANAGAGSESSAAYAKASFQVLSGTSMTAAAGTSLASAIIGGTTAGAALGTASGVLGGIGIAAGVIGLAVMPAVAQEQKENANDETRDFFRDAEEYGFTAKEWGEKLNYLQHVQKHYGLDTERSRDGFPANKPVWEAQPEQFEDFTETVAKNGGLPKRWFGDWEDDHPDSVLAKSNADYDDPSDERLFGSGSHLDPEDPDTFEEFKEDIDLVEIDSIELREDGQVAFVRDGERGEENLVIDPLRGGDAGAKEREEIAEYLTELHELSNPDGELDGDIADEMEDIFGKNDDNNAVEDVRDELKG